jgi:ribonuclease P protein component
MTSRPAASPFVSGAPADTSGQGAGGAAARITSGSAKAGCARRTLVTLKRRPEFLSVRGGARWATPVFVVEGRRRTGAVSDETPRFGFTVSKQVGGAVERNRIKRRLKAAARDVLLGHAWPNYDYVLIARRPALDADFAVLVANLAEALKRVHARSERAPQGRSRGRTAGG